jgi:hypothetical protein
MRGFSAASGKNPKEKAWSRVLIPHQGIGIIRESLKRKKYTEWPLVFSPRTKKTRPFETKGRAVFIPGNR